MGSGGKGRRSQASIKELASVERALLTYRESIADP